MAKSSKTKIKFVGDVDVRVIEKGETWGGRLSEPLDKELRWDWSNNHLLETDDLSAEALELLLEDDEFVDVTNAKTIPVAAVAKRRLAMAENKPEVGALNETGTADTIAGSSSTTAGTGTPAAGGSTAGPT